MVFATTVGWTPFVDASIMLAVNVCVLAGQTTRFAAMPDVSTFLIIDQYEPHIYDRMQAFPSFKRPIHQKGLSSSSQKEQISFTRFDDCLSQGSLANTAKQKKKLVQPELMKALEEETYIPEEPERPLKRIRLRHQDGTPDLNGTMLKKPKLEEIEALPYAIPKRQSRDLERGLLHPNNKVKTRESNLW
ncbi:hypothetical protein Tco_0456276 [Tanacetum coccineum]